MDEVQIEVIEPELLERLVHRREGIAMPGAPQLRGDEDVLAASAKANESARQSLQGCRRAYRSTPLRSMPSLTSRWFWYIQAQLEDG